MPRTIPTELVPIVEAAINSPVELYELYLDGGTRYFAVSDQDVIFGGIQYQALGISRDPITTSLSEQINGVTAGLTDVNGQLSQTLTAEDFRGRRCRVLKVFREALGNPANAIVLFDGRMDQPAISPSGVFSLRIVGYMDLLHRDYPARVFSTQCNYKLGDDWCTVDLTTPENKITGTAAAGSTAQLIVSVALTQPDNYWRVGRLKFTSGANRNISREVYQSVQATTALLLRVPFPAVPAIGDSFDLLRGCNKTRDDCVNKFDNWVNYGGFPYIPKPSVPLAGLGMGGGGGKGESKGGGK